MHGVDGSSGTARAYRRAYIRTKEVFVLYLLLLLILAGLIYAGWRMTRAKDSRSKSRVIGPDDDPEFLWRLGRGPDNPRDKPKL